MHIKELQPPSVLLPLQHALIKPNFAFEIIRESGDPTFSEMKVEFGSTLAFHGTAFENVYSIIHNGFCSHMNKVSLLFFMFIDPGPDFPVWRGYISLNRSHCLHKFHVSSPRMETKPNGGECERDCGLRGHPSSTSPISRSWNDRFENPTKV